MTEPQLVPVTSSPHLTSDLPKINFIIAVLSTSMPYSWLFSFLTFSNSNVCAFHRFSPIVNCLASGRSMSYKNVGFLQLISVVRKLNPCYYMPFFIFTVF
jgi:hypothetical protein